MEIKYQKPRYLIAVIPFGILLIFSIISSLINNEKYPEVTIISIILGAIGTIFGLLMFLYGLLYIYEAKLYNKGICVTKKKNKVFIDFYSISDIVYEKPSIFNYLTSTAGSSSYIFPGFLRINIKTTDGRRKTYFIRLKFKDFQRLPKKYMDLLK